MAKRKKSEVEIETEERPYRIGFTGTRNGMTLSQLANLKAILKVMVKDKVWQAVHGDCVGADAQFHVIARELGASVMILPPSNPSLRAYCEGDIIHEPAPYSKRNKSIVEESDIVIATPGQSNNPGYGGTWQTIRFAQDADKLYGIIIPNGAIIEP